MRTTKVRDFEVKNLIGQSPKFRIYLGERSDGKPVIIKVAKTFEDGDVLAEEAGKFNLMRIMSDEIRHFEAVMNKDSHYEWLFANLEASFLESSQEDRRINVFSLPDVSFSKVVPLAKLVDQIEVDAKTSAWMLGRLFKLYSFFELIAIRDDAPAVEYPVFSIDDYFIEPDKHRIIFYNYSSKITDVIANDYVKTITRAVMPWIAFEDGEKDYQELLEALSTDGTTTFETAHQMLYAVVDELWGRKYHRFTYRDKGTSVWKNLKEDK